LLLFFVLNAGLVGLRLAIPKALPAGAAWPDAFLLVLAAGSTLASLSGQVPAQNALLAASVIGCAGGAAHALGAATGVPFGPFVDHPQNIGRELFSLVPWTVPLIWVVVLLNARGVARLILRPYRSKDGYGFYVMGLTVLLAVVFDLGWEPYAVLLKHYWAWKPTRIPLDWYTAPWSAFLGWALAATLILLFVTPALINKSPAQPRPSYQPLVIWEVLSLLLLTGALVRHLPGAAVFVGLEMLTVALLSLVSSVPRWGTKPAFRWGRDGTRRNTESTSGRS
jgi:uncharacterized membrane protein